MNLLCMFTGHKWNLVAVNRRYHFTRKHGNDYFSLFFYECSKCGCRKAETNKDKTDGSHQGADLAQKVWCETRILPPNSKHPADMDGWQRPEQVVVPIQIKDNVVKLERTDKR